MKNGAIRIAFFYFLISIAWIYLSGEALHYFFQDSSPEEKRLAELFKGSGFIILTTFFLYKLINSYYKNLKKSEELYKDMFEANPNPMWVYDHKTLKFLKVNHAAINRYGYSEEEFLNMSIFDIRPEEEGLRLRDYLYNKKTSKYTLSGIWTHKLKNDSVINVKVISHDIAYNKRLAKLVLALDVTKKESYEKELEKINRELQINIGQLKQSQVKLCNTQKIAGVTGWTYNLETDSFDFDAEFYTLTNIPYSSYSSITLEELQKYIHPADFFKIADFIDNFKQGETKGDCIVKIKNNENWNFIKFGAFLSSGSDGHKLLEGFIQDIDQLTKTNIENKKLGKIINRVKNLVVISNVDGEIEWINKAFSEVTGYTWEESIGKTPWGFIQIPESSQKSLLIMREAVKHKKDFNIEIENITKQGKTIWLQIDGSPIYDEKNKHIGYIAIESEITERKQKENKIKQQNELLYRAAWINSHQVRKPLASILGLIQLMHLSGNQEETQEYLRLLEICSNELDDTIRTSVNLANLNLEEED